MSGRSSRPEPLAIAGAVVALVGAAAGCSKKSAPQADPGKAVALAQAMMRNMPPPAFRDCAPGEVLGGLTLTHATLYRITNTPMPRNKREDGTVEPKLDAWTNPPELDAPAAAVLGNASAAASEKAQAAAELLAAPFYLVYKTDLIDAPMALGFKEHKRGTVGARAIRFDKTGQPYCVREFTYQNDLARNERAIAQSDQRDMDPKVVAALQADLKEQLLRTVTSLGAPRNVAAPAAGSGSADEDDDDPPPSAAGSDGSAGSAMVTPASNDVGSGSAAAGSAAVTPPPAAPPPAPRRPAPKKKAAPAPAAGSSTTPTEAAPAPSEPAPTGSAS